MKFINAANELLDSAREQAAADSKPVKAPGSGKSFSRSGSTISLSSGICESDNLAPEDVMDLHGLDPADWDVSSFRMESEWKVIRDRWGINESKFIHEYFLTVKPVKPPVTVLEGWVPIRPTTPITLSERPKTKKKKKKKTTTALILPDPQIGFVLADDDTSYTTHSTEAMSIALQAAEVIEPDIIVNLGDFFDFAEWSTKYVTPKQLNYTTQASLEAGHVFLAMQRELCDDVRVIEGNHDKRIVDFLTQRAKAAVGLRVAGKPEGWPVMSLQNLMGADELGVEWLSGYPSVRTRLRDDIVCMHGEKLSAKDQASKTPYLFNTIFGHIHRIETQGKTYEGPDGTERRFLHMTPGCLCRNSGEVPGVSSSLDHIGRPIKTTMNWQQGFMTITYTDEVGSPFEVNQYEIIDDSCMVRGEFLTPIDDDMHTLHHMPLEMAKGSY